VLGALDDRIELNRRMNETLEGMAQALFKSWFVDFDPVIDNAIDRGKKMPEEFAERAAVRAVLGDQRKPLPANIRALFPDEFTLTDELGWIPKGWEAGYFGNVVQSRKEKIGDAEAVVLSAVASGELVRSDEHFTKQVYSKNISKYLAVKQWDIAYNPSRINIGSIGMLKEPILGAVSPVYVVAQPQESYRWHIEFLMGRPYVREWINTLSSGSVRQSLSFEDFASIPCVIPPINLTKQFDGTWAVFLDSIIEKSNFSITLSNLRDTLLPKLLSGELRIPDAEKMVERIGG
jgi:type I restriction enzyme, S subunit